MKASYGADHFDIWDDPDFVLDISADSAARSRRESILSTIAMFTRGKKDFGVEVTQLQIFWHNLRTSRSGTVES